MDFVRPYLRPASGVIDVSPREIDGLAAALLKRPEEIEFREEGAYQHGRHLEGCDRIAGALTRRNIRSLLARAGNAVNVRTALGMALTADPEDVEDALEEAELELNLRLSLFATEEARLSLEGPTLTIEGDRAVTHTLERREFRTAGRDVFCTEALFRLLYSRIDRVNFNPALILPMARQLVLVAAMDSEDPGAATHQVDWRKRRKPHFDKQFCSSCGSCVFICLNDAVEKAPTITAEPGKFDRTGVNYDRCVACGLCALYCPGDGKGHKAVVMIRGDLERVPDEAGEA